MKKTALLVLAMLIFVSPMFACWKQYQKDERHTGWDCDITIDLPLCIKWRMYLGSTVHGAVPVIDDDGYSYIIGGYMLRKVKISTGEVIWSKPANYSNTSPLIDGNRIIVNDYYTFYAYDKSNGKLLWQSAMNSPMASNAYSLYMNDPVPTLANGKIFIGTNDGKILKVDSETGTLEGKFQVATGLIVASPAVDTDGTIYVGSNDGYFYCVNGTTGAVKWNTHIASPIIGPASVDANGVYFASHLGRIYKFNKDGSFAWSYLTESWMNAGGALSNGVYFIGSDDRMVYAINTATGILKWKSAFTGDNFADMSCVVICARLFILGCVNKLVSIDAESGNWDYTCMTQDSNFTSMSYSNGTLLFTSNDGYLYSVGKCEAACPCSCDASKMTPSVTFSITPTATRTITMTITQTITGTSTPTGTSTVTKTYSPTPTMTQTYTDTATFTQTDTDTPSFTRTPTNTFTATNTMTGTVSPTFTATICDGVTPPKFSVKMIQDPDNSANLIFVITSSNLLETPPSIMVYPHGECASKPKTSLPSQIIPGETLQYKVIYAKQTGYGDIDKVVVNGMDLCGIKGVSDGSYSKVTETGRDVRICKNVFNPDKNERAAIIYKAYTGDKVEIKVYTRNGILVKTIQDAAAKSAGEYGVYWDGTNDQGQKATSGVYVIVVKCDNYVDKEKVSVMR
jgi:hypothetical protein